MILAIEVSSASQRATNCSYVRCPTVADTLCVFLSTLGRAIAFPTSSLQIRARCVNLVDARVVCYRQKPAVRKSPTFA
jgi:hypothetical protein